MSETYFSKFPTIAYGNNICVNITERATLLNKVYQNPYLYYSYDVVAGERPDNVASRYYDDPYMSWILYFSNKTDDPYYGWYMDQLTFDQYLTKKYGSTINAQSKTSFYRNNWYSNPDGISTSQYNTLDPSLQKYYEPNYGNDVYGTVPLNYVRLRKDWTMQTNSIVNYTVNTTASQFAVDEIVDVYFNNVYSGYGQVTYSGTNQIIIQHVNGVVTGSILGSCYLIGRESKHNVFFTAVNLLTNVIPTIELSYWSPVTYYDYENELNEQNKSIHIMDKRYSSQLVSDLKKIL